LSNGEKLALRGIQDVKGGGHTGAMTGAMVATSIVFFPAAPLFLFMKGKDITIPEGHEITVYTNTEHKIDPSKSLSGSAASNQQIQNGFGPALTNQDVLKLRKAGVGDDLIIAKIQSAHGNYALEPDDMVNMKALGLSDAVIAAMMKANHK
jgi:hypothetical protein